MGNLNRPTRTRGPYRQPSRATPQPNRLVKLAPSLPQGPGRNTGPPSLGIARLSAGRARRGDSADLAQHKRLGLTFRRAEPGWPFREDGRDVVRPVSGNVAANNGETLAQLALRGVGITRVGNFHIADDLAAGRLVPLLEPFNPQDREAIHAVFVGGPAMPARVRVLVDFLVERMRGGGAGP